MCYLDIWVRYKYRGSGSGPIVTISSNTMPGRFDNGDFKSWIRGFDRFLLINTVS